ncbi:MAG: radical SAM protein [Bacteroidota bacterium]|nr:radical SAM protein [Bacteroidota bacterium]
MATFLFDKIIFGPVKSRRLGVSLGINLLPETAKFCNFNCIYCECGWNPERKEPVTFHSREEVKKALDKKLKDMMEHNQKPDVITFAGNGEPTIHPEFAGIIDDTLELRNLYFPSAKVAVLSNATMLHNPAVFAALNKVDDNILKLDSANEATIRLHNNPYPGFSLDKLMKHLKAFKGHLIIQTLFLRGKCKGHLIDNTVPSELDPWLEALKVINPREVMIYTIARDTPAQGLEKVPLKELKEVAAKVQSLGFKTQVSG